MRAIMRGKYSKCMGGGVTRRELSICGNEEVKRKAFEYWREDRYSPIKQTLLWYTEYDQIVSSNIDFDFKLSITSEKKLSFFNKW